MTITKSDWAEVVRKSQELNFEVCDSENYRGALERVIDKHTREPAQLLIIDEVADGRTGMCNTPIAMAMKDGQTNAWRILLKRRIDSDRIERVVGLLEVRGFLKARILLDTPERFLEHVVLHELAHLNNDWGQDRDADCDEWAFDKLGLT